MKRKRYILQERMYDEDLNLVVCCFTSKTFFKKQFILLETKTLYRCYFISTKFLYKLYKVNLYQNRLNRCLPIFRCFII